MLAAFRAALGKDLRLIARDRVGLVFLTVAPMIVITVAGFSLASLYGADPRGATAYVLPLVDEDAGDLGRAIRERLAAEPAVAVQAVADRAQALRTLERREAGVALVIPAGTSRAIAAGEPARLELLTDPVKYLEIANVRAFVQEVRHGIEAEAARQAEERLAEGRAAAEAEQRRLETVAADARRAVDAFRARLVGLRAELERRRRSVAERARQTLGEEARRRKEEATRRLATRLSVELAPVRAFVAELARSEQAFAEWIAEAKRRAGKLADKMPPPPELPSVPAEIARLAEASPADLASRLVSEEATFTEELPTLPDIELPTIPDVPALDLPRFAPPPSLRLAGTLEIAETSVTGAPRRLNTFDQNVPGFSVTFLLLGMLLGVSLALLDERDWGTLERLRATPTPVSLVLVAKLTSRVLVGLAQMILLFAVGRIAFGISLGPEPWALLLPTAGIVFAGTAFGLVVAGIVRSREAVLPIGAIVIVTMAAVGGCWWPIDLEPRWMRSVALGFPTTWVMAAYNDLMIRRQPAAAAIRPTAVLLLHGGVYLLVGVWLFRRRGLR